ncbi:ABC transporter permease [Lichenicola cladoniae]|uniref:ABC transporter permease n=1 Tax=Lichenicola cladoniae TaxID=1484109 RepID=A0A6M8HRP5_9PROT|nr:ABC transporter permease [Lichenicola cladoniae]NPD69124.1 ABC transporter permease [Acetobacteraceae bacterium]QKE90945.1 ABC transporter permease [Lichenicola cladoniae]
MPPPEDPLWQVRLEGDDAILVFGGDWRHATDLVPAMQAAAIRRAIANPRRLRFEAQALVAWDSLLVATLWRLRGLLQADGTMLDEDGLPPSARRLLALAASTTELPEPRRPRPNLFAVIGTICLSALASVGAGTMLAGDIVRGLFSSVLPRSRRTRMQGADLLDAVQRAGPSALPIVGVVNFLLGAILAFIGAVQLRRFAAEIFVSNLVGLALVRELAAVMTAIVLAGRTGGANAARLATMQGNEEIDALRVLGISEQTYLVLPMTLSLMLTMPLLYLYACLIGIAGGALVATTMLDLSPLAFATAVAHAVPLGQFVFGLVKSIAFAALIGLVSCQIGLNAGRSAAAVGEAATRAVVAGIVGVIALDALFAVVANIFGF